jgi:hypothetical protein
MIGAIAGDMIGSVFEQNPIKSTAFPLFSKTSRSGVNDHPHSGWLGFCRQSRILSAGMKFAMQLFKMITGDMCIDLGG